MSTKRKRFASEFEPDELIKQIRNDYGKKSPRYLSLGEQQRVKSEIFRYTEDGLNKHVKNTEIQLMKEGASQGFLYDIQICFLKKFDPEGIINLLIGSLQSSPPLDPDQHKLALDHLAYTAHLFSRESPIQNRLPENLKLPSYSEIHFEKYGAEGNLFDKLRGIIEVTREKVRSITDDS